MKIMLCYKDDMKWIKVLLAVSCSIVVSCAKPGLDSKLSAEASYVWSNSEVTEGEDPHAFGSNVELWKHNGKDVGFFSEFVGPGFDPPSGKLDSIQFDEKSGRLSFTTKLSVGVVHSTTANEWVPTKNLYEFTGVGDSDAMTGLLRKKTIQDSGTATATEENIVLKGKGPAGPVPSFLRSMGGVMGCDPKAAWSEMVSRIHRIARNDPRLLIIVSLFIEEESPRVVDFTGRPEAVYCLRRR